jgi:chromosome partitioning protein
MAFVITVAQQKGGAGKTTLAANLAAAWAAGGARVALLDIDPQRSLSRWHGMRAGNAKATGTIHLSEVAGWRLAAELDRLRARHDIVVIDSPPQIETDARLAIRSADLVLVPIQPSLPDLWAAEGTLRLANAEKRAVRVVLNRAPASGTLLSRVTAEIAAQGVGRLASSLGNRVGFANAFALGLGVCETAPKSVAAIELMTLLAELDAIRG